jgi:hypothetical protein
MEGMMMMENTNDKTAVQVPVTTYLAPDGVTHWPAYSHEQREEYAEEARREGAEAERARLAQTITNANNTASELLRQRDDARAQLAAAQRTAGGDAALRAALKEANDTIREITYSGPAYPAKIASKAMAGIAAALAQRPPAASAAVPGADAGQRLAQLRDWLATTGAPAVYSAWVAALEAIVAGRGVPVEEADCEQCAGMGGENAAKYACNPATDAGCTPCEACGGSGKQPVAEAAAQADDELAKLCEVFGIKVREGLTPMTAIACRLKDLQDAAAPTAQPTRAPGAITKQAGKYTVHFGDGSTATSTDLINWTPDQQAEIHAALDRADAEDAARYPAQPTPPDDERAALIERLEEAANDPMASGNCYVPAEMLAAAARTLRQPVALPEQVKYVPVDSSLTDKYGNHPNDNEPRTAACQAALDARGDSRGQGLDSYWKWGFAAGFNAAGALPDGAVSISAVNQFIDQVAQQMAEREPGPGGYRLTSGEIASAKSGYVCQLRAKFDAARAALAAKKAGKDAS